MRRQWRVLCIALSALALVSCYYPEYRFDPEDFIRVQDSPTEVNIFANNMAFDDVNIAFGVGCFLVKRGGQGQSSVTLGFTSVASRALLDNVKSLDLFIGNQWYSFPVGNYRPSVRNLNARYLRISEHVEVYIDVPTFLKIASARVSTGRLGIIEFPFNDAKRSILKRVSEKVAAVALAEGLQQGRPSQSQGDGHGLGIYEAGN